MKEIPKYSSDELNKLEFYLYEKVFSSALHKLIDKAILPDSKSPPPPHGIHGVSLYLLNYFNFSI